MHLRCFKFSNFLGDMPPDPPSGMGPHVSYWTATNRILNKSLCVHAHCTCTAQGHYLLFKHCICEWLILFGGLYFLMLFISATCIRLLILVMMMMSLSSPVQWSWRRGPLSSLLLEVLKIWYLLMRWRVWLL